MTILQEAFDHDSLAKIILTDYELALINAIYKLFLIIGVFSADSISTKMLLGLAKSIFLFIPPEENF